MNKQIKSNHKKFKAKSKQSIYSQFEYADKKKEKQDKIELDGNIYLNKISDRLKLPSDMLVGAPIITSIGRNQLCLENYRGIIEYTGSLIKVQTKVCKISIEGKNLSIDYFTNEEMRISGFIQDIHYGV